MRAGCIVWLVVLVPVVIVGCTRDQVAYQAALPGTGSSARAEWLGEHAGYLDVRIETAGKQLRFFLDASDPSCSGLRGAPGELRYANAGVLGRLDRGDLRCEPLGILSLKEWRSRRGRANREPIPRARADWTVIHRDAELVLARGRFTLASQLGFPGGVDSVAIFAVDPVCEATIDRGVGSLEFRNGGQDVLVIVGERQRCPLLGIARPLPGRS